MAAVATAARPRRGLRAIAAERPDAVAGGLLAGAFCLMAALTWGTWGAPHTDAGSELATAQLIADGGQLYGDVRYYYGPLGISLLTLALKSFLEWRYADELAAVHRH